MVKSRQNIEHLKTKNKYCKIKKNEKRKEV